MASWFVEIHSPDAAAIQWPMCCACCGLAAETAVNAIAFLPLKGLAVPLCRTCRNHIRIPRTRILLCLVVVMVWMLLVLSTFGGGPAGAVLGLGGLYAALWWAIMKTPRNPTCTTRLKPPAVTGMAHKGDRFFLFVSEAYARKFAAANASQTIWK
jgi:hypothetical protein